MANVYEPEEDESDNVKDKYDHWRSEKFEEEMSNREPS